MIFWYVLFVCTRHGDLYLKLAKKGIEKGADYAKNEIQRLERMLEKVIHHIFLLNIINVSETNTIIRSFEKCISSCQIYWTVVPLHGMRGPMSTDIKTWSNRLKNNIVVLISVFFYWITCNFFNYRSNLIMITSFWLCHPYVFCSLILLNQQETIYCVAIRWWFFWLNFLQLTIFFK